MKTAAAASADPLPAFPDSNRIRAAALASATRRRANHARAKRPAVTRSTAQRARSILKSIAPRAARVTSENHDD